MSLRHIALEDIMQSDVFFPIRRITVNMVTTNVTDKYVLCWQLRHPLVVGFLEKTNNA